MTRRRATPPSADAPLGVFDSGLGGLTVVHALRKALPEESLLYLGDTARVPYGTRSADTVVRYARGCAATLVERGVKALVIACNTASAFALEALQSELDIPVLGVIEPGARAAVEAASDERLVIGVLGTSGLVSSGAYPRAVAALGSTLEVRGAAAPLLVPLVEEGWLTGEVPRLVVERYVTPLVRSGVGVLVLGCTHYPLLRPLIEAVAAEAAGRPLPVIDSAQATARELAAALAQGRVARAPRATTGSLGLLVTDRPASFAAVAERFLEDPVSDVELVDVVSR